MENSATLPNVHTRNKGKNSGRFRSINKITVISFQVYLPIRDENKKKYENKENGSRSPGVPWLGTIFLPCLLIANGFHMICEWFL